MNRREFFKSSFLSAAGIALLGCAQATKAWAADLVKMNKDGSADHGPAKGMGYVADLDKALADSKIKKAAGLTKDLKKGDVCSKCMFWTGKADDKKAQCQVLPGILVHSSGSCNTWVKKG